MYLLHHTYVPNGTPYYPGIDCMCMNISRVGYIRLRKNIDSPFCHPCMTTVHEANWLTSIKKADPSLAQRSLPNFLPTGRK